MKYIYYIMDKTNASDLSCSVFTILISVTQTIKIQNTSTFYKFHQKLANSDITKKALNYPAV